MLRKLRLSFTATRHPLSTLGRGSEKPLEMCMKKSRSLRPKAGTSQNFFLLHVDPLGLWVHLLAQRHSSSAKFLLCLVAEVLADRFQGHHASHTCGPTTHGRAFSALAVSSQAPRSGRASERARCPGWCPSPHTSRVSFQRCAEAPRNIGAAGWRRSQPPVWRARNGP